MAAKNPKKGNQLRSSNLNLLVYNQIRIGLRPSKICEKFDIKKSTLQYYLSSLKNSGFVKKIGYGVWEVCREFNPEEVQKSTKVTYKQLRKYSNFFKSDKVRAHAFQFKLKLPKLRNWENREEVFLRKNIKFKPLKFGGVVRGQSINFRGRKIWLTNKSIIIYEKSSYLADTADEAKQHAIHDLVVLIRSLERMLGANFKIASKYVFKVSRQHYSLIKNSLAKQYNKEGKKLGVYSSEGLWFVIDNSFNLHEAETLHPKTADVDNKKVQDFFNGVKQFEDYTPQFVVNTMQGIQQNQLIFAQNIKSHIKAVQDMSSAANVLKNEVKELKNLIKENGK